MSGGARNQNQMNKKTIKYEMEDGTKVKVVLTKKEFDTAINLFDKLFVVFKPYDLVDAINTNCKTYISSSEHLTVVKKEIFGNE